MEILIRNVEAKELTCMIPGHVVRCGICWREGEYQADEGTGQKIRTTVIASSTKYIFFKVKR